ncbi:hypothetical protein GCM10010149_68760 [Nonomuraea roseoviolacea subsp. roseoviolacea]
MAVCVFCEIIAGRAEAGIVHDDERVVAILDHRPATVGHVLVIPRAHMAGLADARRRDRRGDLASGTTRVGRAARVRTPL